MFMPFSAIFLELSKPNQTLARTRQLHALIIRTRLTPYDPFCATRVIRLYALNEDLVSARKLFDQSPHRSVYLWNSIIRAYAKAHEFENAFTLLKTMLRTETRPDGFTFACIVRSCWERPNPERLRAVHGSLVVLGFGVDSISGSALVTAYSKLGIIDEASRVFRSIHNPDLVLWNSIILGHGCCGLWDEGLKLFSEMRSRGVQPDGYTLVGQMLGFADSSLLRFAQGIHGYCLRSGFSSNIHVGSALVSMYSKCRCLNSAESVFSTLFQPDLVTWSALISGYSQCGEYFKALHFFRKMNVMGQRTDPVLIASTLAASAQSAVIRPGSEIHGHVLRRGHDSELIVTSSLVDMYLKCGFVNLGMRVFETMPTRSTVSYNSVISGLGLHGCAPAAFKMFEEMLEKGFKPDDTTFSALLCTCCHAGLVKNGWEYFRRMKDEFCIQASPEHYVHMVRLLGMCGELQEAYNLILTLPKPVDSGIWGALLSCCEFHGNSDMAESVAQQLLEREPEKTSYRVSLANVYAGDGRWDDASKLRGDAVKGVMWKMPGISWCSL